MKTTVIATMMMALAATATAQVMVLDHDAKAAKEHQLQVLTERAVSTGVYVSVETKPVTGAPYSGEAVTETIQVLTDGNRIVRRTTARVYRDGAGRTRRETLGPDGQVTSVFISDPARGTSFVFDPASNTAQRSSVATYVTTTDKAGGATEISATANAVGTGVSTYTITADAKRHAEQQAKQHAEQKAAQHITVTGQAGGVTGHVSGGVVTSVGPVTWVAEHKSVFAFELGQPLTAGAAALQSRLHPRCGTSFLLIVMLASIVLFALVDTVLIGILGTLSISVRLAVHLPMIPLIGGLSYEVIRWTARHTGSSWGRMLVQPGLWLQRITTREPDEAQLEVALTALRAAIGEDESVTAPTLSGALEAGGR